MNLKLISFVMVLCALLSVQKGKAQGWVWARSGGGAGNESAKAITTDPSGNVYAAGTFTSSSFAFGFFSVNNTNSGYADVFVVKYDPSGTPIGVQSGGGSASDYATAISADPWGYIYVAGYFYSPSITFGSITLTNSGTAGTADMYIVKYDSLGNVVWAKGAGGTGDDRINAIKADAWGKVVVTGSFESATLVLGTDTLKTIATIDKAFVIKYDSAGTYQWAAEAGGTGSGVGYDFGNAITTDAFTNVFVAGKFGSSTITFGDSVLNNTNPGLDDMFLVKYNADGVVQWARNAADSGNATATGIGADALGNVYVCGNFAGSPISFNTTTLTNTGGNDIFLAKYNNSGNLIWAKADGGTADDIPNALAIDDSSYVVLTGNFASPTLHFGSATVTYDGSGVSAIFLSKYDSSGNALWAKTTGESHGNANSVATAAAGKIYVAGDYSDTTFWFGTDTIQNIIHTGTSDVFVAKYTERPLLVLPLAGIEQGMMVYPNPNAGVMTVSFKETGYDNLGIYNCTGRLIYQSNLSGNERTIRINAADLEDGVYLLRSTHNGVPESTTFVIRR